MTRLNFFTVKIKWRIIHFAHSDIIVYRISAKRPTLAIFMKLRRSQIESNQNAQRAKRHDLMNGIYLTIRVPRIQN